MEEPQKTICKKCEVVPLDKTPSTLDNANMSSAERFSQRIRNTTGRKVYQGQPTHLNIYNEKFTTARISFRFIGTPAYYHIIVTSETDSKFFSVTYNEYIAYGYFEATGLIPNTLYTVNIIAHYVSGDAFPLNHKKTFSTTAAEGEVKNIQVRNPSNETFDITVPNFTNLSVSFELLNDKVDYKVILQENTTDVSIVTVSRDDVFSGNTRIVDQLDFHFPTLDFDASYSILVNSVYGNNDFIFSTSREIKTLNEDFFSSLNVSNIQNTSVDLSYNFVDVSNIVYKLYVENDLIATHANYSGIFELRELLIGQEYKNVYVSITFPESNNEYKNKIQDFSFTTLNESPSAFIDTIVRNTSIDVSFLDASGTNEVYTLLITDNNNYDFSYELSNIYFHSFVDLSINTNYDITIINTYPPIYSDVSNTYEVSQSFTTLNEGPVTNVVHDSDIDFIVFGFSGSPNFDNLVTVGYDVYLDGNNIITLDNLDVSFQINNLSMYVSYEVEILSIYPTTNNIYSYKNEFKTTIEGPVHTINATNIQSTSIDLEIIPLGTKVKHFDISLNDIYKRVTYSTSSNEYNIEDLTQNVEYSVTVTVEYESGRRYTNVDPYVFTTVESLLYVILKTGNTITIGYSDNTTELYFGETNISPLPNDPYKITGLIKDQSYDFSTNLAILTVKTLNESAMSLDNIGFTGNTITINNNNNHFKYDISIDPARGDGIFEFLDLTGTPFVISDLSSDTQYTINATSYYDTNNSYISTPKIITTSNESTINVTGVEIRNTSVNILWNIAGSVTSIDLTLDNTTTTITDGATSYEFTDLSINTSYVLNITTNYSNNNSYTSTVEFTTLNEEEANVTTETFFITSGNTTIISIHNTNQNDVSENIIQIADNSYVLIGSTQLDYSMISQFDFIEGNVTTKYKEISPSGLYTYDTRDYITDFSFDAIMYKPLYKVKNDSIELEWFDISTNMDGASYNINFSSSEQSFDKDTRSILFEDLSINTQYDISFTRNYFGTSETFFQSIETLHQGPTDPSGIIVLNSGMQGNIIVIDLSNINPTDVESNTVNVMSDDISYSFTSTRTLFEFDVDIGETYLGNVVTTYVDKISDQLNILYIPDIYVSDDFSFTVQNYDQPYVVRNGVFNVSDGVSYTDTNGSVLDTPDEWYGESIKLSENVNTETLLLGHKFIDNDAQNNVILFKNNQSNDFANLSQNYDFLFQDYYKFAYYVANHVLENELFGSGSDKSEPNIEYQIKFISDNNTFFETSPIVSTDHNWNKFEIKFFIPQSYKNVKLRIQRNLFELNNLFLSDISMVGFGKQFDLVPFFEKNADWTPSHQSLIGDWRSLMKQDSIVTTGNVFSLSSNMTIDFWLYVHDTQLTTTDKGIFLLGDTRTEGSPYIYLQNERLVIQSKIHKKRLPFSPKLPYESKIPMHYSITFGNNKVDIYKNGTLDLSGSPNGHLRESLPTDNIYMGRPDMETLGYVTKNFKLYDFVLGESDIQTRYNNMKTTYSIVGNYYDVSENVTIIQFDDDKTTHTVNYQLHNTNNLQKTVELIAMNGQTSTLNAVIGIPFSVSFWALNTSGLIFKLDGTTIDRTSSLQSDTDGVYIDTFPSVKIKTETNKLQHFIFSIDTDKITGYLNGYLYNSSTHSSTLDITNNELGTSGQISNIEIYDKALSQQEAFTVYHNHYHLYSEYDMTGIHKVFLFNPVGNPETDVSYLITGNTFALSVPTVGTISTETKVIDISMTPVDLNNFHKNSDTFNFKLNDYNIDFEVDGVNKPFLTISTTDGMFTELSEITINLSNTTETYSYEITGIDISDITTNNLTGDISNSIIVKMREDYKIEGLETMVFTIADLGIATFADISDTTINILSINKTSANINEEFIVTLTVPANKFVGQSYLSYSIEIEDELLSMVDPSTNGVFDLTSRSESEQIEVTQSFTIVGNNNSKKFTITLDGTESSASLILNDIALPSITITTFFQNQDIEQANHVDEGGTVIVSISTPRSFEDGRLIPYTINGGVNALDISSSTDPIYNNLTGSFIVNTAKADISFVISENREPNTNNETFKITLDDFPSIFAEVVIIDTVKPIAYLWSFANVNGEPITDISEGEVFTVMLETQGLEDGHKINYSLGGANITIDDLLTNDFTGIFIVPTDMSRNYTVRKDNRTEGDEDLTFTISIQDQPDAIGTLKINDTSQSPNYTLTRNATYRFGDEQLNIDISFSVPNRSNVDELILARYAEYIVTGVDNNDISGDLTGFIDLREDRVINFEKKNTSTKTLTFSTLDTSIQVGLNYNDTNPKYIGTYDEDTNKYTLVTYGQTSDISYEFTNIADDDLSVQLDGIDVSINGTIPTKSIFDDNYVFTLTPHKSSLETYFNIINNDNTTTVGTININT